LSLTHSVTCPAHTSSSPPPAFLVSTPTGTKGPSLIRILLLSCPHKFQHTHTHYIYSRCFKEGVLAGPSSRKEYCWARVGLRKNLLGRTSTIPWFLQHSRTVPRPLRFCHARHPMIGDTAASGHHLWALARESVDVNVALRRQH
jgi:hypothetical protein